MKYRQFGSTGWSASVLGFGCHRFPLVEGDWCRIDEAKTIRMLRFAIDSGVNYIDTGYDYHCGNSERVIGKALRDGYRDRVRIATKLPCWLVKEASDFDRLLDEQLGRLEVDHVDFYLLHRPSHLENTWPRMRDLGVFQWAERAKTEGRIGGLGFSFHGATTLFKEIVDAYEDWTMCLVQYNYMEVYDEYMGAAGIGYAASKGLPIVVMEPLLGGRLVNPPPHVRAIWSSAAEQRTPAEWAFRWLWNQPDVTVVLGGMNTLEQVQENLATADASGIGMLDKDSLSLIDRVRSAYLELRAIPCTQCRYCLPCQQGIDIPLLFSMYNRGLIYDDVGFMRGAYSIFPQDARASACEGCRDCEARCSQRIAISEWMPKVHAVLGEGMPYP